MLIGTWAVGDARERAAERFDRSLLSAALAISRDVAISDGDALTPRTSTLLRDTSGGPVFYHVYAPDGVFVTGYATRPAPPGGNLNPDQQVYFDASYLGQDVRALRFQDVMQVDALAGEFTVTVWQDLALRQAIVRDLSRRTFSVMASLMIALSLIVWFGVRTGLSPLIDLQSAIARRSSDDLSPIQRAVPVEASGIVQTLNQLLGQVSTTIEAKDAFISNAAHQLRNPIAGVLAMSEAVDASTNYEDMKERSEDLVQASRHVSDLAKKLLAYERAKALRPQAEFETVDVVQVARATVVENQAHLRAAKVSLSFDSVVPSLNIPCDEVMLSEAITNLIDNAMAHGGPDLSEITVSLRGNTKQVVLSVSDNGRGIDQADFEQALERFGQIDPAGGSGLGLPIAKAVAQKHGGDLKLSDVKPGLRVEMTLSRLAV